jgi:hypothetical protein
MPSVIDQIPSSRRALIARPTKGGCLQRIAGWDPLLDRHVGEQGAAALPVTSHVSWAVAPF